MSDGTPSRSNGQRSKAALVAAIIAQLETSLAALRAAALETYAAAIADESKPENKYDTRALEASYLAGAQAKRVLDVETSLGIFRNLELKAFKPGSRIESTALVEVDLGGKAVHVFIAPAHESIACKHEGRMIQVITPQSPLGAALLGLCEGDIAKVDKSPQQLEYEVVAVE